MTQPMDVERTLRDLETKWRKPIPVLHSTELDEPPIVEEAYDATRLKCADELKAVREALREPGVEAAPPTQAAIVDGNATGVNQPRAAAGESTERPLDLDGLIGQVLMGYGAGFTRDRIKQICEKWLAASQERSATEEK